MIAGEEIAALMRQLGIAAPIEQVAKKPVRPTKVAGERIAKALETRD